jgi:hypothetical protein
MLLVIGGSAVLTSNISCGVKHDFYGDICFNPNFSDITKFMKVMAVCWILQCDFHLSECTHTTMSKLDTSFTFPLQDYFLMQHTENVWDNVLINQNSSSIHRHIFRYWMLSTGHLHPTELLKQTPASVSLYESENWIVIQKLQQWWYSVLFSCNSIL